MWGCRPGLGGLVGVLHVMNVAVIIVTGWALWVRRDSIGSKWDAPMTGAIALFAVGAALDSPWPAVGAASFALTGKFYLFTALGHISYLSGAALGLKTVCLRLTPDDAIESLMRSRVWPGVLTAAVVMMLCLISSPATSTMPAESLYQVRPDGWLIAYWIAYFGTMTAVNLVALNGANVLRREPDAVMVTPLAVATVVGTLACLAFFGAIVSGHGDGPHAVVWLGAYVAIIGGAVASALSWRRRARALAGR